MNSTPKKHPSILLAFFIGLAFMALSNTLVAKNKPNVILIYADDLGRGLLSYEGQKIIKTPNIDRLASAGIRFKNAYGCMYCAPARASLLTGYHDCHGDKWSITRAGLYEKISLGKHTREEVEATYNRQIDRVEKEDLFLAEMFQESGYVTGQVGKLDWGFATTHKQLKRHGWDYYYGYYDHQRCHGFYPPFLFENGEMVSIEGNTLANCGKTTERDENGGYEDRWNFEGKAQYSQDLFLKKILSFLESNKDKPFFLYHPTQLPHGPSSIPKIHPDFANDSRLTEIEKTYASMVKMLDDHVGVIIDKVKELGIADNTIVVFTGDNGHEIYYPSEGKIAKPVRNMKTGEAFDNIHTRYTSELAGDVFDGNDGMSGIKRHNWEGGVRVPLLFHWPGRIEGGVVSDQMVANYDLMATFAELLSFDLPESKDGTSYYRTLFGKKAKKKNARVVYAPFQGPALVTHDGWKLRYYAPSKVYQLYNLRNDYQEKNDLAQEYPERVETLKVELIEACSGNLKNGWFAKSKGGIGALPFPSVKKK